MYGGFVGIGTGVFTGLVVQPALGFQSERPAGCTAGSATYLVGGRSQLLGLGESGVTAVSGGKGHGQSCQQSGQLSGDVSPELYYRVGYC